MLAAGVRPEVAGAVLIVDASSAGGVLAWAAQDARWKPLGWLVRVPAGAEWSRLEGALPVVRAMLIGVAAAALPRPREVQAVVRSLFEGQGQAYGSIISLTIAAQCFGAGLAASG